MSKGLSQDTLWHQYPMGPKVQAFLELSASDYQGAQIKAPSEEVKKSFDTFFLTWISSHTCANEDSLIDLMDELIAMDKAHLALILHEKNKSIFTDQDFRGVLSLGIASMLCHDLDAAEEYFLSAQNINTAEPAPYVNLSQIAMHKNQYDYAEDICLQGLKIDKNNLNLWQIYAEIAHAMRTENIHLFIREKAEKLSSWAGYSLAHHLNQNKDNTQLLQDFSSLYAMGERDPSFLIEYTAVLGQEAEYEKLLLVVRNTEKNAEKNTPYQFFIHGSQAALQLGNKEQFFSLLKKAEASHNFSPEFLPEIAALKAEAE